MKIGIDAFTVVPGVGAGGGGGAYTYIYNLVQNIARIDQTNEYYVFGNRYILEKLGLRQKNFHTIIPSIPPRLKASKVIWQHVLLPRSISKYSIDIMHFPFNVAPLFFSVRSVLTIHDLIGYYYIDHFPNRSWKPKLQDSYFNKLVAISAQKADRIIAISNFTKQEVVNRLQIPPEKIDVIYYGIDNKLQFNTSLDYMHSKIAFSIPEAFILCVATISKHKNIVGLLRAYQIAREKFSIKEKLIVAGIPGSASSEVQTEYEKLGLHTDVILTGFLDSDVLAFLYQKAKLFVLVSFIEGFGAPLVEAMKAGLPIIASQAASLPEVLGDAGVLVDPYDVESIAYEIAKLLTEKNLRTLLSKKALDRAERFSWLTTAQETLGVYNKVWKPSE